MYCAFCNLFRRFLTVAIISCLFLLLSSPATADTFTNVTDSAGVFYLHCSSENYFSWPLRSMLGGAAAGDFDGDGWIDLFVARLDNSDILFRNRGNDPLGSHLGFEDVSEAAGLTAVRNSNGAAWGDIDNDGDLDLYLTTVGADYRFFLYVNNGDGTFSEDAIARGADLSGPELHFGYGATFGDYDRDGFLDMHITEWVRHDIDVPAGTAVNTRLLHNNGRSAPGYFTDLTDQAGVNMDYLPSSHSWEGAFGFSSRFVDFDGDSWQDLLIVADFTQSRIFWNNGDGTFLDGTFDAILSIGTSEMGSAVGDFDFDGDLDLFVTDMNTPETGNRLYRYDGDRYFTDVAEDLGVNGGGWDWGCAFIDYDNDGDLDIIVTNGMEEISPFDSSKLWRNDGLEPGGSHRGFTDVSLDAGIVDDGISTGLLTFDYDRDGDVDVFLVGNRQNSPILYRNDGGNKNDYLRVKTIGTQSNSQGLGAFISVMPDVTEPNNVLIWEINAGTTVLGQDEIIAHFGLGPAAKTVDLVTIRWPSGQIQDIREISPSTTIVAREPQ